MNFTWGWDGGGTKTRVICLSEDGRILAKADFGPLNLNGSNTESVRKTVQDAVRFMADTPFAQGKCRGLAIGAAGISNVQAAHFLEGEVRAAGYAGLLYTVGDQDAALAGAIEGPGAVLIAGTGAICCGRGKRAEHVRVGGYGYLIDDGGSGYAIGRDILAAVVRAEDGRIAPTVLTSLVTKQLAVSDVNALITWLYAPGTSKKEIAALAPLLLRALELHDAAAERIAETASEALAELAGTTWRRLGLMEGELAMTGSILTHYIFVRTRTEQLLKTAWPAMHIIAPHFDAAYGAALLARGKHVK